MFRRALLRGIVQKGCDIVQTAAAAGQFKTLVKLAGEAALAGALEGKGPLKVLTAFSSRAEP